MPKEPNYLQRIPSTYTTYGDVTIERVAHNGHLIASTIHDNQLVHQTYIDYSEEEAVELFREYLLTLTPA
jgi:hypothetical protein